MSPSFDSTRVREHILRSIAIARGSPFSFPACYLDLQFDHMDLTSSHVGMHRGLHNVDADGCVNVAALATLADIALSTSMRQHVDPLARMATVSLVLQFNGQPIDGDVKALARYDGQVSGLHYPQGQCSAELRVGERVVAHASANFVNPPLPAGVKLAPLTTNKRLSDVVAVVDNLDKDEKYVFDRAERALRAVNAAGNKARSVPRSFIEEFWGQRPRRSRANAMSNALTPGFHTGNRVGHLQGGVLFGVAAATAKALAPAGSTMTGASAWFISPGTGPLKIKSCFLQEGKNISVVRTEVFAEAGIRVLEMVTGHARKGTGPAHK